MPIINKISKNVKPVEENIFELLSDKNKTLPTRYLYNSVGSKLFEEICDTEEYYITRTEKKILDINSTKIIEAAKAKEFFELGSGSSKKTKVLILEALKKTNPIQYMSFDISEKALMYSLNELKDISNNLKINLVQGDFLNDLDKLSISRNPRMYLFLGSTLGNFKNSIAIKFLSNLSSIMKKNDTLLIGVDKLKEKSIIKKAYNDKLGITAKFNKNILNVINKKFNLKFNLEYYKHETEFNENKNQIEMYLKVLATQKIIFPNNELTLHEGDRILTEISRKFTDNTIKKIFHNSSLDISATFSDNDNFFSLYLLKPSKVINC